MKQKIRRLARPACLGTLYRTTPISDVWGFDRGTPVDRYFIEQFLEEKREFIRGTVIEIKDSEYTDRFGSQVLRKEVLDIDVSNPRATIIADLAAADAVAENSFDCFILTQTLHIIYDCRSAIQHAYRILKPNGRLLVTVPCVSRTSRSVGVDGDYWRFTTASARAVFGEVFGKDNIVVSAYGNVLTSIAFLTGMAAEELPARKLNQHDPFFPMLIAVLGTKIR